MVIAGDGLASYVAEINHQLAQMGLEHRTHCLGFVSGQQKDLLLQGSNLQRFSDDALGWFAHCGLFI